MPNYLLGPVLYALLCASALAGKLPALQAYGA
ncbi:MAG: hypothetical protein RLZZ555_1613, partial [Pseudomonadota bacterium]